jgi:hypothetical protein
MSLTGELVLRESWSEVDKALKIIPAANTEFSIELSADDGDSVVAIKRSVVVEANTTVDAKGMQQICLYAAGTLSVSPSDSGEDFITIPATVGQVVSICARRVRVTAKAVMQG